MHFPLPAQIRNTNNQVPSLPDFGAALARHHRSITFPIRLFADGVSIYEANNNGRWHELGFLLGIGASAAGDKARGGRA
jgi:hypothetical protein